MPKTRKKIGGTVKEDDDLGHAAPTIRSTGCAPNALFLITTSARNATAAMRQSHKRVHSSQAPQIGGAVSVRISTMLEGQSAIAVKRPGRSDVSFIHNKNVSLFVCCFSIFIFIFKTEL